MKRRFQVTLLAVAIAVVGSSAFAVAPTINALPDVVISDDTPATDANLFVYPDALDADTLANDTDGTVEKTGIIWSYYSESGNYKINDQDSLDVANPLNDPNNPSDDQVLGRPGAAYDSAMDDPEAEDSNLRTLTFRDAGFSPVGGAQPYADPGTGATSEVVRNEVVTLFASDGSSWSMKNMMVWTESEGRDRLSQTGVDVPVPPPGIATGWVSTDYTGGTSGLTMVDNNGLCIYSPGPGDSNYAEWTSSYGIVDLVANAVYQVRLTMDSGGTALPANTTPFWDFVIDNNGDAAAQNKYAADFMNQDNEGGANSVGLSTTIGLGSFEVWYAPPAVSASDWNDAVTGQFTPANDDGNDMRFNFRVLDVINASINGASDEGTLCLREINVTRYDMSQLTAVSTLYEVTDFSTSTHVTSVLDAAGATISYTGGNLTVTPNTTWSAELIQIDPGDGSWGTGSYLQVYYPLQWETGKLLKGTVTVQAPNAVSETNPVDAIQLIWDGPTNEILYSNELYAATNNNGLPKQATTTDLVAFFYTHNASITTATDYDRLRLRVLVLCSPSILSGGETANAGGITLVSQKIEEVAAP